MSEHIIDIRHLSKSFGGVKVLDDINFYVRKGEFVTLLGPSGCGKTTILRHIAGFISPDEGSILLDGKDISGIPPYQRPLNTVFQRYALFPHLDVFDNIAFGLKLQKLPAKEIKVRVEKMLKMVSMTDYEDRSVDSLSGGQQQRVAIARALVNYPKVLLLDEPLAALDLKMRKDMQLELKEIHRKMGITFIYVTHDQEEALTLSDTIVVINEGRIQQIGTPTDIYNEPCNSFVADFIGESTILNGRMIRDRRVEFMGHEFDCVDEGFGENVPVDVVVRPEDVIISAKTEGSQFTGVVQSCIFKGVHYEMFVDTDKGYELMVQDYDQFEPGSTVGLSINPEDIQVMHKERTCNTFDAEVIDSSHVLMLDEEWECEVPEGAAPGDILKAEVDFSEVDLLDHQDEGKLAGEVHFLLYKGDHYHLTVKTEDGDFIYVDTDDIWDKGDLVGIDMLPGGIKLSRKDDKAQ
ncbi:MAG: polyamine ABC transporter ATP-binding protein [Bacteroidales bacterium]|nr:polyamine ABC transporter ATP-binding protein [Bacteroidales bacterium]